MNMRLAKREVREANALRAIVDSCQTVRVGAVDEEGMFIVPMSFGYDWELDESGTPRLTLWLHSAGEGRKAAAFRANGNAGVDVAIEMDCEDTASRASWSTWLPAHRKRSARACSTARRCGASTLSASPASSANLRHRSPKK